MEDALVGHANYSTVNGQERPKQADQTKKQTNLRGDWDLNPVTVTKRGGENSKSSNAGEYFLSHTVVNNESEVDLVSFSHSIFLLRCTTVTRCYPLEKSGEMLCSIRSGYCTSIAA